MPRHARLRWADCPWHVIQRGVNRSLCFTDDVDRQLYLALFKEHAAIHSCKLHAYVLMTNHVHLLISPGSADGISRTMKALGERYVRFFNRRHGRTGTLWEGRFRSGLITPHELYCRLGNDVDRRAAAYRSLFHVPTSAAHLELIRNAVNGGFALADPPFIHKVQATTELPVERRKRGRKRGEKQKQNGAECSAPREKVVCPLFE